MEPISIESTSTESTSMEPIPTEPKRIEPTTCEKPTAFQQQSNRKRKAEEKHDYEQLSLEIDASKQKITRNLRPKRHRQ
ncbi:unnamed protein product [Rotaria sordida]|nr:unnamed protein product [Rotaria sordida]CAF1668554.1 unnamed protein product [Rotaria sordida]